MARRLGIKRCWFHKDHYDIPKRRVKEIEAQCNMVSSKKIVAGSMKIGKNFKKMVPVYEYFGKESDGLDWSDKSLNELYLFESNGSGEVKPDNGYYYGKKMLNVTVAMWKEDLDTILCLSELYNDPELPNWWLDKVFKTNK